MAISIIVAHDKNNGIGLNGKIPWYISEDFKWFKRHTIGKIVVMGTTTYFSLPDNVRPLPGRNNYVLCGECEYHDKIKKEGAKVLVNYHQVLELSKDKDLFVIGGASLYDLFIDYADYLYITKINKEFECDTFFPSINGQWDHVYKGENIEHEDYTYNFNFYAKTKGLING
jgi:dihydrofolate reductase